MPTIKKTKNENQVVGESTKKRGLTMWSSGLGDWGLGVICYADNSLKKHNQRDSFAKSVFAYDASIPVVG